MKIETQPLENHQVKLTVEVEAEKLEDAKQRAARQLAKQVRVPGFRPGKAPYAVILRAVGEGAVLEEAMDLLVQDIYPKMLDESGVKPYGPGTLEKVVSTEPPVLEFVVPLEAEVSLGDYRTIQKPYELKDIAEDEIEKVLENLQKQQAIVEPVERAAQEGDLVTVKMKANRTQVEEGEDPVLVPERSMPILVRPEDAAEVEDLDDEEAEAEEWPFPGFSRHLIGLSKDEEKTVTHTFSDESPYESLRGVEAEFSFQVEAVKSRILPELNDEFAKSVGEFADMPALKEEIRSGMQQQAKETYDNEYTESILDELIEISEIKFPPQMLEREIDDIIHNLGHRLEQSNMDIDMYLKTREMDMEALREEVKPSAETRMKKSLVLLELAKAENIQIQPEELQMETANMVQSLSQTLSQKEARRLNDRNVLNNITGSILVDLMTQKTMTRLREIASGQVDQPSTDEVKNLEVPVESVAETGEVQDTSTPEAAENQAGEAASE